MPFDEVRVGGHGLTHTQLVEPDDFSVAARSLVDMSHLQETVVWLVNQVTDDATHEWFGAVGWLWERFWDCNSDGALGLFRPSLGPPWGPQGGVARLQHEWGGCRGGLRQRA